MCGIGGVSALRGELTRSKRTYLRVFDKLLSHRGPDGSGHWGNGTNSVFLVHHRLAIIDVTESGAQPMLSASSVCISYNGEIYNYKELRTERRKSGYNFRTESDTEVILATYDECGLAAFPRLRGMFSIALWDENSKRLVLARDRFGIKPLYYCVVGQELYFASEAKALLPFLPTISTDNSALAEYLTFQYTISGNSMFHGIQELPPAHILVAEDGHIRIDRYWDVSYDVDFGRPEAEFREQLRNLIDDSISVHLRSDVEVAAYVSGGLDSSLLYGLASSQVGQGLKAFHGLFGAPDGFDESAFAHEVVSSHGGQIFARDITSTDFRENITKVIYHLDQPVAGPGSFPQYMVSELASNHVKVVLGGQGGDEIFGGYARYLIAYFEQCVKAAIDGTYRTGNYVVTIESIVPNLGVLQEYKPLIQEFWRDGLFGPLDERFFRLVDRSHDLKEEVDWSLFDMQKVYQRFSEIFNNRDNVEKEAYFDSMTHFEFKTLLPALLHVEDRMSMAHGVESRVPFLDHPVVEFAATVPADVKFKGGRLKHLLRSTFLGDVPESVLNRRDKMGFPVPLSEWFRGDLNGFFYDVVANMESKSRPGLNTTAIRKNFEQTGRFSRKTWALLSLELWHQQFHDRAAEFRALARE